MKLAVIGVGGIGSTFAVQLSRGGHDVTVVARRKRLEALERDGGIRTPGGVVPLTVLPADVTPPCSSGADSGRSRS